MPPRFTLPVFRSASLPVSSATQRPCQFRYASILASLSDNPGAYNKRIRRGRGPSSGKGKTSGRGHKGQKQHGKVPFRSHLGRFNGGQTPIEWVHGKRGFTNQFSLEMTPLNLDKLQHWISTGRLDPTHPITVKELLLSRCVTSVKDGVKLLAKHADTLTVPVDITVSRASAAAIAAVEAAGGMIQTRYYTHESITRVLKGETHPTLSLLSPSLPSASSLTATSYKYRLPDPTSRKDLEYYRDEAHRGYLSGQVQTGQGPSLFFKTPTEVAAGMAKRKTTTGAKKGGTGKENRLW